MTPWTAMSVSARRTLIALMLVSSFCAAAQDSDPLAEGFRNPPIDSRLRMFWRVFGPAWERREIDRELREAKQAGIGGLMTFFFYPAAVEGTDGGIHNQRLGSPEFLETLSYAAGRTKELGLRFDIAGGSGWPYGGPTVET